MWRSFWNSSNPTLDNLRAHILVLISAYCQTVIVVFLSPTGKCGIDAQNSLKPLLSTLHPTTCLFSPWHPTGRLNQSYQPGYSNTYNSGRQYFTYHYAAVSVQYLIWNTNISVRCLRSSGMLRSYVGSFLPMFQDSLPVQYSRVRHSSWTGRPDCVILIFSKQVRI